MNLTQAFILAMKSILGNKVRSILTMLGIIVGVGAVIVIVGFGDGMENYMTESFRSFGTNQISVNIQGRGSQRSVSTDDMYRLKDENTQYLSDVSPVVNISYKAKAASEELSSTIRGIGEDYDKIASLDVSQGRFIEYIDNLRRTKVCVIGSYLSETYFSSDPIGQSLSIAGNSFTIVGVLEVKGDNDEGSDDDCIYIPYGTAAKMNYTANISSYSFSLASEDVSDEATAVISNYLYSVFEDSSTYSVTSMSQLLDTLSSMINMVVVVLSSIAAISLFVGGIGIMNIMLISVTERTKEIGIRKAVGAKSKHIMWQFVTEAAAISLMGGGVGIILGYVLCAAATKLVESLASIEMTVAPNISAVIISVIISALIGIIFGYIPAKKAADMNPIDALRYD